jgi:glycosyltransferase involved in cell wall biosynthesis
MGLMARRDRVDVLWGGAGLIPLVGFSGRSVLSVHDLVHKIVPESMSTRGLWANKLFFQPSLARAHTIVANSQGTADRLRVMTGYIATAIVRPGVSRTFARATESRIAETLMRLSVRRPYVLGVSTLEPRKGLDLLIRAFASMQSDGELRQHTLVLVGDRGWRDESLTRLVNESGPQIVWLGFVQDEELVALYSGCDVFVYPSKYEGFGMPVLEARACGARVVTSDVPEIREAGGDDAIYVKYGEPSIRDGIRTAITRKQSGSCNLMQQDWSTGSSTLAQILAGQSAVTPRANVIYGSSHNKSFADSIYRTRP